MFLQLNSKLAYLNKVFSHSLLHSLKKQFHFTLKHFHFLGQFFQSPFTETLSFIDFSLSNCFSHFFSIETFSFESASAVFFDFIFKKQLRTTTAQLPEAKSFNKKRQHQKCVMYKVYAKARVFVALRILRTVRETRLEKVVLLMKNIWYLKGHFAGMNLFCRS